MYIVVHVVSVIENIKEIGYYMVKAKVRELHVQFTSASQLMDCIIVVVGILSCTCTCTCI